jgi:hypothetical protein
MIEPARNVVRIAAPSPVTTTPLEMGDDGCVAQGIRLTSRYVTVDGTPWIPVMGEYHFSRDLPHRWETELRKMKAGGISVLATYMIWNLHEEVEGEVRWDGHRDVRRFVETIPPTSRMPAPGTPRSRGRCGVCSTPPITPRARSSAFRSTMSSTTTDRTWRRSARSPKRSA